jgi:phage baseplate assembly protein W
MMSKPFLGRGWKFPIAVDPLSGKIKMAEYEDDIAEAIKIILWTLRGERMMRPEFGSQLQMFMFSATDETSLRIIEGAIEDALYEWEPRIHQIEVNVQVDPDEHGRVLIDLQYQVRSTNVSVNQVYPFYLNEGTNG